MEVILSYTQLNLNNIEYNTNCVSSLADSLGHVQSPVCDIISEPGVAGKTLGQERVVAPVGGTVFHQSARKNNLLSIMLE